MTLAFLPMKQYFNENVFFSASTHNFWIIFRSHEKNGAKSMR